MPQFTKKQRQEIIDAHIEKYGGYNPRMFLQVVRASNGTHPAWSWFDWNDGRAAEEYRVIQAREFGQGLRISFEITQHETTVKVKAPAVISPLETRKIGGYRQFVPENDMPELRRQAARELRSWAKRYQAAIVDAGLSEQDFTAAVDQIDVPIVEAAE